MLYRVWFNRGNKNPDEAWVIVSKLGEHRASCVYLKVPCKTCFDPDATPQGWIECEGEFVWLTGSVAKIHYVREKHDQVLD